MNQTFHTEETIQKGRLFQLSNLFSLLRIALIPVLAFYLAQSGESAALKSLVILVVAGISDGLDGYFARKLNQVSQLGMILDPLADKVLAGALVIMLIFFRDFPIWLAIVIVGRDLLILAAAAILLRGKKILTPSNLSGKYAFVSIVALLSCAVIRFEFGVTLMTYISLALIVLSVTNYVHVFSAYQKGEKLPVFKDQPVFKITRVCATALVLLLLLVKLYRFYFG